MIRWAGMEILDATDELVDPNIPRPDVEFCRKRSREHVQPRISGSQLSQAAGGSAGASCSGDLFAAKQYAHCRRHRSTDRQEGRYRRGGKQLSELAKQPEPQGFPPVPEIVKEVAPRNGA